MPPLYGEKSWQIPNQLDTATASAREALEWVDVYPISEHAKYALRLAIEEMVTNTIKYGYDDHLEHVISIRIRADRECLRVELEDDGHPFDPTAHPDPDIEQNFNTGVDGGFGLVLVRRICRHMDYRREGDRNRLALDIGTHDPDEESCPPVNPAKEPAP
jgi:serine/threonine-protein kinase RsbW